MTLLKNRFLLILFLIIALSPLSVKGQYTIAVNWDIPESDAVAIQELEQIKELGVSHIKTVPLFSPSIWHSVDTLQMKVYGDLGIRFPISSTFSEPDSTFLKKIRARSQLLLKQESVVGIGLFSYGSVGNKRFINSINPFFRELQKAGGVEIYYKKSMRQNAQQGLYADFPITDVRITEKNIASLSIDADSAGFYQYSPSASLNNYLTPFHTFLEMVPRHSTIIVDDDWLFSALEKFPIFKTTLESLTDDSKLVFPLPEENIPRNGQSPIPIILLFILWATIALHYNISPLYRKSLFRYFTAHKFFVDDIFRRHIRTSVPAILIILQHALIFAAIIFAVASTQFSPLGLDAIYSYIGWEAAYESSPLGLTIPVAVFSIMLALLSILWLYFGSRKVKSLTQTATLYSWPLQINFLIGTVIVVIYSSGGGSKSTLFLALLAALIQIGSFILTSFDTSRFVGRRPLFYLAVTSGIYLLAFITTVVWGFLITELRDIISLATAL